MKTNGDKASLREVYKLVEDTRKELGASILRLETKFDNLEAGRLSTIETKLANIEARIFTAAAIIAFVISGAIALGGIFIQR